VKKIEEKLIEFRLDYDKRKSKSKFGAQKVVLTVYAPISEITKTIRKKKGELYQVNVFPVNKERVEFIPLSQQVQIKSSLRRLIVGIDPGLTVGLSILDLNGRILKVESYREATRGQIIREITRHGKPTLICVDVYPYPSYVEKISATLNSRLYTPRSVMTVSEKNDIARKLAMQQGVLVKNAHQRDSLASAYRGYTKHKSEFEKIDKKYFNDYDKSLRDEIKDLVVKGKSPLEATEEIQKMIEYETVKPKELPEVRIEEKPASPDITELENKINLLQEQLDWERRKNSELHLESRELEEKAEYLQMRLDEGKSEYIEQIQKEKMFIVKDNKISFLEEKVKQLEDELERYENRVEELKRVTWLRNQEGWLPIKVIKKFTNEEIENTAKNHGLGPGDTVLILDTTGGGGQTAEQLLSYNIKAIIGNISQFSYYAKKTLIEKQTPLADISDVEIKRIDEIAVIKEENLLDLLEKAEQKLDEVLAKRKAGFLDTLVDDYRKVREIETKEYDEKILRERKKRTDDNDE